jgi:Holliday junction DNA helicase RuvB
MALWEADDFEPEKPSSAATASSLGAAAGSSTIAAGSPDATASPSVIAAEAGIQTPEHASAGSKRSLTPELTEDDLGLDRSLRPRKLEDYIGQSRVKENLAVLIAAAKQRGDTLDHLLFSGPPGLGKTTLSSVVANELGTNIKATSGPAIERAGDLAAILTNLEVGDVLFIDEIHRLNRAIEEVLYPAMEDFVLDIVIGKGPAAQSLRLDIPRFTLVGATTRTGLLTGPLRDRFGIAFRLDYYNEKELHDIIVRSATILDVEIDREGALEIARRSRGTPRLANRLLKRVRDFASVRADNSITIEVARAALAFFEVDELGLDTMDNKILELLVSTFGGKPVGLNTLANALGEDAESLEDVYEPYLLQQGLIQRTPKGRVATERAFAHRGVPYTLS